jgi:hypothetical protein
MQSGHSPAAMQLRVTSTYATTAHVVCVMYVVCSAWCTSERSARVQCAMHTMSVIAGVFGSVRSAGVLGTWCTC